jgi:hypothetical protein
MAALRAPAPILRKESAVVPGAELQARTGINSRTNGQVLFIATFQAQDNYYKRKEL